MIYVYQPATIDPNITPTKVGQVWVNTATGHVWVSIGTSSSADWSDTSAVTPAITVSATDKVLGRFSSGSGPVEEIACTAAARSLIDDATVADMVNTLFGASSSGTGGAARLNGPTFATGTITDPAAGLTVTTTWNDAADTFDACVIDITSTASAAASNGLNVKVGGSSVFSVRKDGKVFLLGPSGICVSPLSASTVEILGGGTTALLRTSTSGYCYIQSVLGFSNNNPSTADLFLVRDGAANTLAQRNGTAAQAFRVYNTYTDASNYERGALEWSGNNLYLRAQNAGTGSSRSVVVDGSAVYLSSGGTLRWFVDGGGVIKASLDNTYDIGASGASRPRHIYLGGNLTAGGILSSASGTSQINQIQLTATLGLLWNGRSRLLSPSDGVVQLVNNATTDFDRLQFGGTTSSFPAIKRRTTALEARLADDSAITTLVGAMVLKAGAVSDTDFTNPVDGCHGYDTTNFKHYIRSGGTWRSSAAYT